MANTQELGYLIRQAYENQGDEKTLLQLTRILNRIGYNSTRKNLVLQRGRYVSVFPKNIVVLIIKIIYFPHPLNNSNSAYGMFINNIGIDITETVEFTSKEDLDEALRTIKDFYSNSLIISTANHICIINDLPVNITFFEDDKKYVNGYPQGHALSIKYSSYSKIHYTQLVFESLEERNLAMQQVKDYFAQNSKIIIV